MSTLPLFYNTPYNAMMATINKLVPAVSTILDDPYCGVYDPTNNLILIDKRMSIAEKRSTLAHEFAHWHYGDNSLYETSGKQERRARRTAALLLVNPEQYKQLEQEYEGCVYHIAKELEVTEELINDYKNLVLSK